MGRFNFRGTQQQQLIGELSGGERNRVHLAKVLKSGGNVLLLDEPTNDLDVETLRALEEGLLVLGAGESTIRFCPPLMIERETVEAGLYRFERALAKAEQEAGMS